MQMKNLLSKYEGVAWLISVLLALLIGIGICWWFWEDLHANEESLSTTIRNLGLVIGGVIAVMLAVWRSRVAEGQAATDRQGLLNERYQKGAEMLGSAVLSVRMGGIYALQRLAEDEPRQYHIQIMGLLCAFVRQPTRDEHHESSSDSILSMNDRAEQPREDVRAILEILCNRSQSLIDIERQSNFAVDLRGSDLRNARLVHAKLSNAILDGANLSGAQLTNANLSKASLRHANFSKSKTTNADLSNTILDEARFDDSYLCGTNFSGSQMLRAKLNGARLLNANLSSANLFEADLSRSHLMGCDFSEADLLDTDLSGAFFANPSEGDLLAETLITIDTPVRRLTQAQLDSALYNGFNRPKLDGINDSKTGEPLVWKRHLTDVRRRRSEDGPSVG